MVHKYDEWNSWYKIRKLKKSSLLQHFPVSKHFTELNNAIEKIVGGYHPSRNKIYKFVNTVLENSIKGMFLQSDGDIKNNDSENQYGKNQAIRFKEIISKIETI